MALSKSDSIVSGTLRIVGSRMVVRGIGLVSTLITARLLTPADFGLVAIAAAIRELMVQSTEFGFNVALIQFQDVEDEEYCTAWTLNALRGVLLAVLLFGMAWPASRFLGDTRLFWIFTVLALSPLLEGFESTWFVKYEKEMRFAPMSLLMIGMKIAGAATTITLAFLTHSYWALILGMIVTRVTRTVGTHLMRPGPVKFTFKGWRRLMAFSGWLGGAQFLGAMSTKLDNVILQKMLSAHAVGIFSTSRELTTMMFQEVAAPLRNVLFPALSKLKAGTPEFRHLYLLSVSGLFMLLAPLGVGLALVADLAVPMLLGSQWHEAIQPMRLLALMLTAQLFGITAQSSVTAAGQTKVIFWRNVVFLPIRLGTFIMGVVWGGLMGGVYGYIAGGIIWLLVNIAMAQSVIGDTLLASFKNCARSLGALAVMAGAVLALRWTLPTSGWLDLNVIRLLLAVLSGMISYIGAHLILWQLSGRPKGAEQRLLDLIQRFLGGNQSASGSVF